MSFMALTTFRVLDIRVNDGVPARTQPARAPCRFAVRLRVERGRRKQYRGVLKVGVGLEKGWIPFVRTAIAGVSLPLFILTRTRRMEADFHHQGGSEHKT